MLVITEVMMEVIRGYVIGRKRYAEYDSGYRRHNTQEATAMEDSATKFTMEVMTMGNIMEALKL